MYESVRFYRQIATPTYVATPTATPLDAATTAWVAAVVVNGGTVSGARQTVVNNLIVGLKADGVFTKLDRLWLFAAENAPSALTDIISDSLATAVNAPTFATDLGYTGDGSSSYVDSNFNATTASSPHFVQNSASIGAWSNTSGTETGGFLGLLANSRDTAIEPDDNGVNWGTINNFEIAINSAGEASNVNAATAATTAGVGFFAANRDASLSANGYCNGSQVITDTTNASTAPVNANFIFGRYGFSIYSTKQICGTFFGENLTSTEHGNLYARLRTYMTAVGVP